MRMNVKLPEIYNSWLIDGEFIPSALIAKEIGEGKDTLQRRVKRGGYQEFEIAGNKLLYDEKTGGKDIQLKTWNGRNTICYSKMLFSMIILSEQEKRHRKFDLKYNFQGRVTAESYKKNFDSILARLRREIDLNGSLNSKTKDLLHLLRVLISDQSSEYEVLLTWFENYEPESSKQVRECLRGKEMPPL